VRGLIIIIKLINYTERFSRDAVQARLRSHPCGGIRRRSNGPASTGRIVRGVSYASAPMSSPPWWIRVDGEIEVWRVVS
jgi:hypothetical protein